MISLLSAFYTAVIEFAVVAMTLIKLRGGVHELSRALATSPLKLESANVARGFNSEHRVGSFRLRVVDFSFGSLRNVSSKVQALPLLAL